MTTKFPKALAAAGLAAVLVGCGGGSETVPMETGEPDAATLMMQRQDSQRMAITNAIRDFGPALAKVTNEAPEPDVTAADAALAAIMAAIEAAADLSDTEKAGYRSTYQANQRELNGAKARRTKYMEDKKDKEEMEQAAATKKARDDAAKLWIAAITRYKPGFTIGDATPTKFSALKDEVRNLKVDHKDGTTTIELTNEKGRKITNIADTPSPTAGWTAKRFTKTADKSRGVIITSRGGATDKVNTYSYANFFFSAYTDETKTAKTAAVIQGLLNASNDEISVSDEAGTIGQLTFGDDAMLKDSYFGGTRPRALAAGEKQDVTFLGVEGEISCPTTTGDCSIDPVTNKNNQFEFSKDVKFTPDVPRGDDLNDVIVSLTEAGDNTKYLSFGYWLVTTDDPKHTIHTFAQGHGYNDTNSLSATPASFTGKATYSGGPAGVYVLKTGNLADNPDLHDGEFVADVELTAQFGNGNGTIAPADQWKIEGNIDRFRSSNTAHDLSGWDLGLSADLGTRNASDAATNPNLVPTTSLNLTGFKGATNPVTNALKEGAWVASFYGETGAGTETAADNHPEAVVGEFDGHFINGHVVGAFGAVKDD